jgi:Glutaredoxin-like domain (DUF836)
VPAPVIEVFSRRGCHLCDELIEELLPLLRGRFILEVRDVDTREDWRAEFGLRVPVVRYLGRDICQYRLDREALREITGVPSDDGRSGGDPGR